MGGLLYPWISRASQSQCVQSLCNPPPVCSAHFTPGGGSGITHRPHNSQDGVWLLQARWQVPLSDERRQQRQPLWTQSVAAQGKTGTPVADGTRWGGVTPRDSVKSVEGLFLPSGSVDVSVTASHHSEDPSHHQPGLHVFTGQTGVAD